MAGKGGAPRAPSFRDMNLDFELKGGGRGGGGEGGEEGRVGRRGRKWGKEGGLGGRFEGGFGQVQGSLEKLEGRGRWGTGKRKTKRHRRKRKKKGLNKEERTFL